MQSDPISLSTSTRELFESVQKQAASAPRHYQRVVKYYLIARYFVAVYESRYHKLPLQVWNEYRNALDHFVRHITISKLAPESGSASEDDSQLVKMEAHLLRAALDILKFNCHYSDEWFQDSTTESETNILSIIDEGEFWCQLSTLHNDANELFTLAKTNDQNLGQKEQEDELILRQYTDATFAYEKLRAFYASNLEKIAKARSEYNKFRTTSTPHQNLL